MHASDDQELALHTLTLLLAVNRQLGDYRDQQVARQYQQLTFNRGENRTALPGSTDYRVDIAQATALVVGVGNAGLEIAKLCKAVGLAAVACAYQNNREAAAHTAAFAAY